MKKTFLLLLAIAVISVSCLGPQGPPGPPGQDGDGLLGKVFEVTVDFTPGDNYEAYVKFPNNVIAYDSDVVQAYILAGVNNGVDVWEPLPQTLFFDNDILLYGYNYTMYDIIFFLDGTVNFNLLDPSYKNGVTFRVAVIPADFAKKVNVKNYNEVFRMIDTDDIIKLD